MLDPDQARHLVGPDLDPNCLHTDGRNQVFCGIWFKLSMSHKKDREQKISCRFHTKFCVNLLCFSIKISSQNSIIVVGANW